MLARLITERAALIGLDIGADQAAAFEKYHEMLLTANEKMNLTRVSDDISEAADRNYLDSIAPARLDIIKDARTIADIGSGAGLPGIPLAIVTGARVTMIDALAKRVEFLKSVIEELGLDAEALHIRAEEAGRKSELRGTFDVVTARAVSGLNTLCEYALPLLRVGGHFVAYKGPKWPEELEQAKTAISALAGEFVSAEPMEIPGRDWAHAALIIRKTAGTHEKYPRRAGMPEKKPL